MVRSSFLLLPLLLWNALFTTCSGFSTLLPSKRPTTSTISSSATTTTISTTSSTTTTLGATTSSSVDRAKFDILQLGAAMDRGQQYNPTAGEQYSERMNVAKQRIIDFCREHGKVPTSMDDIQGEWELVLSTVPHGIFRSSPFFLAIQEAYESYAETKVTFGGQKKADLFFKLHELQTCSWGASSIGRVGQFITQDKLYSEFDTALFKLTVIPILGWFKLLPTFGGCVITVARAQLQPDGELAMIVDYTTARKVPGLQGLGEWIWNVKVPVNALWKLLPWNQGREPTCKVYIRHVDDNFRIVEDIDGEFFVYTRPVVSRNLMEDLINTET